MNRDHKCVLGEGPALRKHGGAQVTGLGTGGVWHLETEASCQQKKEFAKVPINV